VSEYWRVVKCILPITPPLQCSNTEKTWDLNMPKEINLFLGYRAAK
jgi:hypothetical protein